MQYFTLNNGKQIPTLGLGTNTARGITVDGSAVKGALHEITHKDAPMAGDV